MTETIKTVQTETVEDYVIENQPVEQDDVVDEFGNRGLRALKELMTKNRVSYSIDWKLVHERRDRVVE